MSPKQDLFKSLLRKTALAASGLFFVFSCLFLSYCQQSESEKDDKKATGNSENFKFINHAPDVKYTGRKSCVSCHQEIYQEFLHTGKGRSLYLPDRNNIIEDFSAAVVYDKYTDLGYKAFWRGNTMYIGEFRLQGKDTIHYREEAVDYIVGSGNQTRTYMYEENGYFYEMPVTWYVGKQIWDLSPGYEKGDNTGYSRTIGQQCMECHNSEVQFVPNSVNRFKKVGLGMSCEKCHGPGEAHLKLMQNYQPEAGKKQPDMGIVHPGRLPVQLQFDVCRQCHLEGITVPKINKDPLQFRPGMALSDFQEVFLPVGANEAEFGFASHAERLQMSACFKASGAKLTCNTCHNPHQSLKHKTLQAYDEKCQTCHQPETFAQNHPTVKTTDKSCVTCHMPKSGTTDIPHVSSTDHLIRVVSQKEEAKKKPAPENKLVVFKSFTSDETKETDREHLMANLIYYEQIERDPAYLQRIAGHLNKLTFDERVKVAYLQNSPPDFDLNTVKPNQINNPYTAFYLAQLHKNAGLPFMPWHERSLALAPDNLDFMVGMAEGYTALQQPETAKQFYAQVLQRQPFHKKALLNSGYLFMLEGNFQEALRLTEKAIKADPNYTLAYENRINIYLQQGNGEKGLQLLDELIKKHPSNSQYKELRKKVVELMKQQG